MAICIYITGLEDNGEDSMTKEEREYQEKYGNVPTRYIDRIDSLLKGNFNRYKGGIMSEISRLTNMKWKRIDIIAYFIPKPTPRPRCGKFKVFYVKNASNNRKRFRKFRDYENLEQIFNPAKFYCTLYLLVP